MRTMDKEGRLTPEALEEVHSGNRLIAIVMLVNMVFWPALLFIVLQALA